MADDLTLQLLKAQLPGLHRDAQAGDAGARRELVRVVETAPKTKQEHGLAPDLEAMIDRIWGAEAERDEDED